MGRHFKNAADLLDPEPREYRSKDFNETRNIYVFRRAGANGAFKIGLVLLVWAEIGHNGPKFQFFGCSSQTIILKELIFSE